jgi:L-iditol 2-dehydrogenase
MRALVLTEYGRLQLADVDMPTIGANEVLIRVTACGICGSDVHGYDGTSGRRIPPIIMGHEAAGTVVDTGSDVNRAQVGDRVTFDSTVYCGTCDACRRGQVNLCPTRRVLGVSCNDYRQNGAFAEFVAVPQHILYSLPSAVTFEQAVMIEPLAIALHAVARLNVMNGERAVVVGSGMIGLLTIQALRVAGCREVMAVDLDDSRLEIARQVGAHEALNPTSDRAPSEFDIAVEVVGNAPALATAIASVRRGGRIGLIGNLAPEVPFPLQSVVTRELTLVASCASAGEYPRAIELLASGEVNVASLISAVAPLTEGQQWFDRLRAAEPGLMKVILQP